MRGGLLLGSGPCSTPSHRGRRSVGPVLHRLDNVVDSRKETPWKISTRVKVKGLVSVQLRKLPGLPRQQDKSWMLQLTTWKVPSKARNKLWTRCTRKGGRG